MPQAPATRAIAVGRRWEVPAGGTDPSAIAFWFAGRRHVLALISDLTRAGVARGLMSDLSVLPAAHPWVYWPRHRWIRGGP
uniref:hypothetical protein n=1 Tax=Paractinoplanes polyasparticus TaxID=2856853 RepID=UPI001C846C72|nr:hypothetical protein [Actinoplanes polyasparticus]